MEKTKFCPAMWLSGFFGLGAFVQTIRFVARFSMAVNGHEIPLSASGLIAIGMGVLSIGLLILSLKRPCQAGKGTGCCK